MMTISVYGETFPLLADDLKITYPVLDEPCISWADLRDDI